MLEIYIINRYALCPRKKGKDLEYFFNHCTIFFTHCFLSSRFVSPFVFTSSPSTTAHFRPALEHNSGKLIFTRLSIYAFLSSTALQGHSCLFGEAKSLENFIFMEFYDDWVGSCLCEPTLAPPLFRLLDD